MLITDAVLLIDAETTLNSINRKVMLHYLKFICPIVATYKINCYATPSRLFIVREGEILSSEEMGPNSYGSICIRHSTINQTPTSIY